MTTSNYQNDSIFWVEVERIKANPYQPRKSFDEAALASLAESIRQYGVLQPLTVTRKEVERPGEGIFVEYELIAGERRWRASKIAGLVQVPVVIRTSEDTDRMKLELAIIENLQREDLNPVDRALAFQKLAVEFGLKHIEIGKRVGKSREYVSNTLRILLLPQEMLDALASRDISEGHTRPLLMLADRKEEQQTLFTEITTKRLSVRDAEQVARRVATERVRKQDLTPDLLNIESALSKELGTRVRIQKQDKGTGGKVIIDFFSPDDLAQLRAIIANKGAMTVAVGAGAVIAADGAVSATDALEQKEASAQEAQQESAVAMEQPEAITPEPVPQDTTDADLYDVANFSI